MNCQHTCYLQMIASNLEIHGEKSSKRTKRTTGTGRAAGSKRTKRTITRTDHLRYFYHFCIPHCVRFVVTIVTSAISSSQPPECVFSPRNVLVTPFYQKGAFSLQEAHPHHFLSSTVLFKSSTRAISLKEKHFMQSPYDSPYPFVLSFHTVGRVTSSRKEGGAK